MMLTSVCCSGQTIKYLWVNFFLRTINFLFSWNYPEKIAHFLGKIEWLVTPFFHSTFWEREVFYGAENKKQGKKLHFWICLMGITASALNSPQFKMLPATSPSLYSKCRVQSSQFVAVRIELCGKWKHRTDLSNSKPLG